MLCVKPCVALCCGKKHEAANEFENVEGAENDNEGNQLVSSQKSDGSKAHDQDVFENLLNTAGVSADAHGDVSELFIHQLIETIEFVLGTISNTASYLRLWALSLAHSQLAEVFLTMSFGIIWKEKPTLTDGAITYDKKGATITIGTWIMWYAFMTVTFAVLMMMDVLECFLHTLRLHWVEFQNKFFQGTGYLYSPFSFKTVFAKEMARKV